MRLGQAGNARIVERVLWLSRLVIIVPVIFCLLMSFSLFYLATVDAISLVGYLGPYADPHLGAAAHAVLTRKLVTTDVKSVDVYLLAAVLFIVALGLYELFIGRIEAAEQSELASRLLLVRSLDDLKDRLAKVVLIVLVVEFLQQALNQTYRGPLDLFYLAAGIVLVGAALYLAGRTGH